MLKYCKWLCFILLLLVVVYFIPCMLKKYGIDSDVLVALSTFGLVVVTTGLVWIGFKQDEATRASKRAFVFLERFEEEITYKLCSSSPVFDISAFILKPRWRNSGSTATKNMVVSVQYKFVDASVPPEFQVRDVMKGAMLLGPQATGLSEILDIPASEIDQVIVSAAHPQRNKSIFVWVRAEYDDIFGVNHSTEGCYRLRLSKEGRKQEALVSFIQVGSQNFCKEGA